MTQAENCFPLHGKWGNVHGVGIIYFSDYELSVDKNVYLLLYLLNILCGELQPNL